MSYYFLSLGSNISPHHNVPRMLEALLTISPSVEVSRIVETAPVGMPPGTDPFLNLVVRIRTIRDRQGLKRELNAIERQLGRDRSDPRRSKLDRQADMDILFVVTPGDPPLDLQRLPTEPYVRPLLLELLEWLGMVPTVTMPDLPAAVTLSLDPLVIGDQPRSLTRDCFAVAALA